MAEAEMRICRIRQRGDRGKGSTLDEESPSRARAQEPITSDFHQQNGQTLPYHASNQSRRRGTDRGHAPHLMCVL